MADKRTGRLSRMEVTGSQTVLGTLSELARGRSRDPRSMRRKLGPPAALLRSGSKMIKLYALAEVGVTAAGQVVLRKEAA